MNWKEVFDIFRLALSQTASIVGDEVVLLNGNSIYLITRLCGGTAEDVFWKTALQAIWRCIEQQFPRLAIDTSEASRDMCEAFYQLVRKTRSKAHHTLADDEWANIISNWNLAVARAREAVSESRRGDPSLQDMFFQARGDLAELFDYFRGLWHRYRNDPVLGPTLKTLIRQAGASQRLKAILATTGEKRRHICERMCDRARRKRQWADPIIGVQLIDVQITEVQLPKIKVNEARLDPGQTPRSYSPKESTYEFVPSLTSGLSCLPNPSAAEILFNLLFNPQTAAWVLGEGIPEMVAWWFGEVAAPFFDRAIQKTDDQASRIRCVDALGIVGGCSASGVLCGLLWKPWLSEHALTVLDKLASVPCRKVMIPSLGPVASDPPSLPRPEMTFNDEDKNAQDLIKSLLDNIDQLRQQDRLDGSHLDSLEDKIRKNCTQY